MSSSHARLDLFSLSIQTLAAMSESSLVVWDNPCSFPWLQSCQGLYIYYFEGSLQEFLSGWSALHVYGLRIYAGRRLVRWGGRGGGGRGEWGINYLQYYDKGAQTHKQFIQKWKIIKGAQFHNKAINFSSI